MIRWMGCIGALITAIGMTFCAVMTWQVISPGYTIILLILALVALGCALWQYNQARFH